MKINFRRLALICLAGLGVSVPVLAHAACNGGSTFTGGYSILVAGNSLPANTGYKYISGALHFDGNCHFKGRNISGGLSPVVRTVSVIGTYNTNKDGTISLTMTPSDGSITQTYILGYSHTMNKAVGIEMDGSATATINLQAQLTAVPTIYSNSSLKGTFATTCDGLGASKDDLNYFMFDGAGNLAGPNPYDRGGAIGNKYVTGYYTVRGDGTFFGRLNGGFSIFSFSGVISNNLNEIQYTYAQTAPNLGGIVACTGWQ